MLNIARCVVKEEDASEHARLFSVTVGVEKNTELAGVQTSDHSGRPWYKPYPPIIV